MVTFNKSHRQLLAERGALVVIAVVLTAVAVIDQRQPYMAVAIGVTIGLIGLSLWQRIPTSLQLGKKELRVTYTRGTDLVIPYDRLEPNIYIPRFRMKYKDTNGNKRTVDLGAYWTNNGVRMPDTDIARAIEKAAGRNFYY